VEKRKVFVFGNLLLEKDSLAIAAAVRLKNRLEGIEFVAVQSLDEVEEKGELWIMDVAEGIERVELIEEIEMLQTGQPVSGHDFDLAMELKLLKKMRRLGKVKIIAIPVGYDLGKAVKEVEGILSS